MKEPVKIGLPIGFEVALADKAMDLHVLGISGQGDQDTKEPGQQGEVTQRGARAPAPVE